MSFDQFLHQPRSPAFTGISLVTTVAVESTIVWIGTAVPGKGTNAIGGFVLGAFLVLIGSIINAVAGSVAHMRHEFWGGRIAALGTASWFVTMTVFLFLW